MVAEVLLVQQDEIYDLNEIDSRQETGCSRDLDRVQAAITKPWSNGPAEGQVNRLKTIKRQMYGRVGVELLRARLVPLPVLQ